MTPRPEIPRALRREVLVEAGHRCAIPTCRHPTTEIAHIEPWAKVKEHAFDNLIALCPTCHSRYDKGEIDRPSMRQYKENLAVLTSRYGEYERRIFELAAEGLAATGAPALGFILPFGSSILLRNALRDNLIEAVEPSPGAEVSVSGVPLIGYYSPTERGAEFVRRWASARELE